MILKHKDQKLNLLRLAAFGAVALYLYKVNKKEGSLNGASPNGQPLQVNAKRVVDSLMPWIPIDDPITKEAVRHGISSFANGFLNKKGIGVAE